MLVNVVPTAKVSSVNGRAKKLGDVPPKRWGMSITALPVLLCSYGIVYVLRSY